LTAAGAHSLGVLHTLPVSRPTMSEEKRYSRFEFFGLSITLRQRAVGGPIWLDTRLNGERIRQTTSTRDPKAARAWAETFLRELIREALEAGDAPQEAADELDPPITTHGGLFDRFREKRIPELSKRNAEKYRATMAMFEAAWGRDLPLDGVEQALVDGFALSRKAGGLVIDSTNGARRKLGPVEGGTVYGDFVSLSAIYNWGKKQKAGGRWIIRENPLSHVRRPSKPRRRRQPVADPRRFMLMLRYADQVERHGRFRLMLMVSRYTGHRNGSIRRLRVRDCLLTRRQLVEAAARLGVDTSIADHWPHGGLWWERAWDKIDTAWITPIPEVLAEMLREYIETHDLAGDDWLFPNVEDLRKPVNRSSAGNWIVEAERVANQDGEVLPHLEGGRWHPYRRMFRSEKRKLGIDDKVVALCGGWTYKDAQAEVMNELYLHFDPPEMYECVASYLPDPTGTSTRTLWAV
jgi:hypothetical protein